MNAADDRAAAHAQRLRARRALDEADAAVTRLNEARTRARVLLRRAAGEGDEGSEKPPPENPEDTLRRRMRQIENRMQETDARMRLAELDALRAAEATSLDEPTRDEPFPGSTSVRDASGPEDRREGAGPDDDVPGGGGGDVGARRSPSRRRR